MALVPSNYWRSLDDWSIDPWRRDLTPALWSSRPFERPLGSRWWLDDYGLSPYDEYWRPKASREMEIKCKESFTVPLYIGPEGLRITMDVSQFKPWEVTVKTTYDSVTVEAKHGDRRQENGTFVARTFTRRYSLPLGYNGNLVTSNISDGVLTIRGPAAKRALKY
jgi:HSP20 family molecular chaperone IbpA